MSCSLQSDPKSLIINLYHDIKSKVKVNETASNQFI